MARSWLIDAYNLMHQIPSISRHSDTYSVESHNLLIESVGKVASTKNRRAILVFDGHKRHFSSAHPRVNLVFSAPLTADDYIMNKVQAHEAPQKYLVITDDREIIREAQKNRVQTIRSSLFSEQFTQTFPEDLPEPGTPQPPRPPEKRADVQVSDQEVAYMKKLFEQRENQ